MSNITESEIKDTLGEHDDVEKSDPKKVLTGEQRDALIYAQEAIYSAARFIRGAKLSESLYTELTSPLFKVVRKLMKECDQ